MAEIGRIVFYQSNQICLIAPRKVRNNKLTKKTLSALDWSFAEFRTGLAGIEWGKKRKAEN